MVSRIRAVSAPATWPVFRSRLAAPRLFHTSNSAALVYVRTMAGFVLVWWLGAIAIGNPVLMPTPLAAAQALVDLAGNGELADNVLVSLQRLGISFGFACVVGIPLGLLIGLSVLARDLFEPMVEMLRPISGIAWVPLGLYLVGIGDTLPILIMFYGAVFPLVLNTAAGVQGADRRLVQAARTLGVGRWQIFRQVLLPATLPSMLVGARLAVGAAWISMVAA
ncbi:MAG TPA: ABC transporter permease, partial [Acetobacteraceae bacterium]